jgi:hypothetical protein
LIASPAIQTLTAQDHLEVGGGSIEISLEPERFDLPEIKIVNWVEQCARAVSGYFGRYPVDKARVRISTSDRHGVSNGKSFGGRGVMCRVAVNPHATEADLQDDWILTHEMVHFGFPSVPEQHHWIEEGTATYVEPIARARAGNLSVERVWSDMIRDMHQGLPESGDRGLDNTHTWGRTYWGGALFCLLADVEIRKRTANQKGLEDALRAINRAGGTIDVDWPLARALETGDRATGGNTLAGLYEKMRAAPMAVDLPDLWKQLGVERRGPSAVFDDQAPLAAVRRSIMKGSAWQPVAGSRQLRDATGPRASTRGPNLPLRGYRLGA